MNKCLEDPEMKFPEDTTEKLRHPGKADSDLLEKMSLCIMQKMGYMSENGVVQHNVVQQSIKPMMKEPSKFDKLMEMCDKTLETPGKTAAGMLSCVRSFHQKYCGC